MSGLDTRGFMDGALRGFDVMDRHLARQENAERTQRLDERNEQRYQDQQIRLRDQDKKEQDRYDDSIVRQKKQDKLHEKQVNASIAANKATKERNNWKVEREKEQAWLSDNKPLIAAASDRYIESGGKDVDPILDNPYIKGGANDIRSYTGEMFEAVSQLETTLPKVIDREISMNDPAFIQPLGKLYENRIKVGIGEEDETGKVIKDKQLTHVTNVADIDPHMAGNQPGMVLGVTVTYADGSTAVKPITENRSAAADDNPLVIPLDAAMQNITQRMAKAKAINFRMSHPEEYKKMLENQEGYKTAVYENEQSKVERLGDEFNRQDPEEIQASTDHLNQAAALRYNIDTGKPKPSNSIDDWVGGSAEKLAFLDSKKAEYRNQGKVSLEQLNADFVTWAKQNQKSEVAKRFRETNARYAQVN